MATKKQYRSMRGKNVDMDLLRKKNELTPAVGNAKVNARGDELGPGGKIVRTRDQIVSEYYKSSKRVLDETPASESELLEEELSEEELEMFEEAAEEDVWIEDSEGNFVKKGE